MPRGLDPAELFEAHGPAVFRRCRQLLGVADAAHDAVQEVFLRALAQGDGFRGDSSPLTWLYAIATTHCLQQLRNGRARAQKLAALQAEGSVLPERADPDQRLLWEALLSQVDPELQQVALLRRVDGLTLEEVAEVTSLSRKTVAKKLTQFASAARAALEEKP